MNNITHKIYLCNITFSEKIATSDEKELRKHSENYNTLFNKRKKIFEEPWRDTTNTIFAGVVDYLPTSDGVNIKDSANILVYLYDDKFILYNKYKSCIKSISKFIISNNIKAIQLSGEDVDRLIINGVDIVNDIKANTYNDLEIIITKKKYSSRGYSLIV